MILGWNGSVLHNLKKLVLEDILGRFAFSSVNFKKSVFGLSSFYLPQTNMTIIRNLVRIWDTDSKTIGLSQSKKVKSDLRFRTVFLINKVDQKNLKLFL